MTCELYASVKKQSSANLRKRLMQVPSGRKTREMRTREGSVPYSLQDPAGWFPSAFEQPPAKASTLLPGSEIQGGEKAEM